MIIELKDSVTTLETSQRLKELGVRQDSQFYWFKEKTNEADYYELGILIDGWIYQVYPQPSCLDKCKFLLNNCDVYSAYNSDELGVLLPERYMTYRVGNQWINADYKAYDKDYGFNIWTVGGNTGAEAEARGKMLIYLIEQKIVTAKEINKETIKNVT